MAWQGWLGQGMGTTSPLHNAKGEPAMTKYKVFCRWPGDEKNTIKGDSENHFVWQYMTEVQARSARAAIADAVGQTAEQDLSKPVEFVAVPARSWNPVKVQVEQALKFS